MSAVDFKDLLSNERKEVITVTIINILSCHKLIAHYKCIIIME